MAAALAQQAGASEAQHTMPSLLKGRQRPAVLQCAVADVAGRGSLLKNSGRGKDQAESRLNFKERQKLEDPSVFSEGKEKRLVGCIKKENAAAQRSITVPEPSFEGLGALSGHSCVSLLGEYLLSLALSRPEHGRVIMIWSWLMPMTNQGVWFPGLVLDSLQIRGAAWFFSNCRAWLCSKNN